MNIVTGPFISSERQTALQCGTISGKDNNIRQSIGCAISTFHARAAMPLARQSTREE
jgi:hypothetical protein